MNKVVLLGFISQEPVSKEFPEKNMSMTRFSIAVTDLRNYNQSYFFNCVGWNQIADYVSSNLHKGDFVAIDGRLTNRSYVNDTGNKVYITEVMVDNIRNLGSRKSNNDTTSLKLDNNSDESSVVNVDELIKNHKDDHHEQDNHDDNNDDYDDIDWEM